MNRRVLRSLFAAALIATVCLSTQRAAPAGAAGALQVLATPGGQPDDIAVDAKGRLIWGNLARHSIERLQGRRIVTVARNLAVPEGLVPLHNGSIILAEQGNDQILRVGRGGRTTLLYSLSPVAGQEGVDGIGQDPHIGDLLIPDSPRGTVLRMRVNGRHARIIAGGLGRPVAAAVDTHRNILVPDEHLGTLIVISPKGRVSHRGTFATPDDVAIDRAGRVWVTSLGDGGLWVLAPRKAPRRVLAGLGNPQGLTLDRCGDPIVVEQTTGRIVRLLRSSSSSRCPF